MFCPLHRVQSIFSRNIWYKLDIMRIRARLVIFYYISECENLPHHGVTSLPIEMRQGRWLPRREPFQQRSYFSYEVFSNRFGAGWQLFFIFFCIFCVFYCVFMRAFIFKFNLPNLLRCMRWLQFASMGQRHHKDNTVHLVQQWIYYHSNSLFQLV